MKKAFIVLTMLLLMASPAIAGPFVPQLQKFNAPSVVKYDFDGKRLDIPVTVSGKPANAIFCVYTKNKGSTINKVSNGYLGWHYVNKIDTSIYISPPTPMAVGSNTIAWNGKDDDGGMVPAGDYTYYLWGYDNVSPKQPVNQKLFARGGSGGKLAHIQETGPDGKVLANPIWYGKSGMDKWVIGYDPADSTLIETTSFSLGSGWSTAFTLALMPGDHSKFFIRVCHGANKIQGVRKMNWVPNGVSQFDVSWADNGILSWSNPAAAAMTSASDQPGPEIVGDFLYTANNLLRDVVQGHTDIVVIDWKGGTLERNIDITDWWTDPRDLELKGQLNGGPNGVNARNGLLFLNCHCSCIKQLVDPAAENDEDFVLWTNQNGDYILDHNYAADSAKPWACNDLQVGPYTYHLGGDNNLFSIAPSYNEGATSFGLLAPDGDGIGYFAYANDTAGWKWFNIFVDSGCAYDGIYCDNEELSTDTTLAENIPGIYYIAHDSIKGTISTEIGVTDAAPAAFSVAQNTPNPFNPSTTINFSLARAGKTTVDVFNAAGQKVDTLVNANLSAGSHSVTWNAARFSAGVYFYTVKSGEFSKTVKMTLLK